MDISGSKGCVVLMSEEMLPPLPPSPASTISNLDSQFITLSMSSDMPNPAVEASPPVFSNTSVPLLPGTWMMLINSFDTFCASMVNVTSDGLLSHMCQALENSVTVCPYFLCLFKTCSSIFYFCLEMASYQCLRR